MEVLLAGYLGRASLSDCALMHPAAADGVRPKLNPGT
jgi:hypothetical protein